ncbi:MAG TPA: organomercurial lyase [Candidatus Dormibacteraeota bacterium]|nr:organomercurial lyase [Candidatus Dormibacteraeota bacterium]
MNTTAVPSAPETAASLRISDEQAVEAYRQLGEGHVYVLEPTDPTRFRMANPFSTVPTAYKVEVSGKSYYGNCVWDGLGIVSLMGGTGQLKTHCPDCGETLTLVVSDRALVHEEGVVHFSIPAAHWWDDIIYT